MAAAIDGIGQCHIGNGTEAIADHTPEHSLTKQLEGMNAKLLTEHAIKRRGRPSALKMSQYAATGFATAARYNEGFDIIANAPQATVTG